ncbi:helix-turn-helix domain-containing protein [Myxococcota bacterium]|nr:helix-turn-helix domain-containing protein [Myxococcota bacterium]MCZ7619408.1 helix-turn-helix domain-containing protein [Myxococcota bacterium]
MRPWTLRAWKPRDGYDLVGIERGEGPPPGRYLVPSGRALEPVALEDPLLVRRFAELDANDPAAVLAFATERGWLGTELEELPSNLWPAARDDGERGGDVIGATPSRVLAEPLSAWVREVGSIREALRLAASKKGRAEARELVNDALGGGKAHPRLSATTEPRVRAALLGSGDRVTLHPVASNLAGALWLQVAEVVSGDLYQAACVVCGRWFSAARPHARFCPGRDACRQAATEERRRKALRLYQRGERSFKSIAERVGARSAETVRGWVRKAKAEGRL